MIRKFTANDLINYPSIKILEYQKGDYKKEFLLVERKPFVSCLVVINNTYGIFVEQFRPIIDKNTLEIPMGKIEDFDTSPKEALIRELREEINLFLDDQAYLLLKDGNQTIKLIFDSFNIIEHPSANIAPGFSLSTQYPYTLYLQSDRENLLTTINNFKLFSQEDNIKLHLKKLDESLLSELDGISRYYLMDFLYNQLKG